MPRNLAEHTQHSAQVAENYEGDNALDQRSGEITAVTKNDETNRRSDLDNNVIVIITAPSDDRTHYITKSGCHVKLRPNLFNSYSLLHHLKRSDSLKSRVNFQHGQHLV